MYTNCSFGTWPLYRSWPFFRDWLLREFFIEMYYLTIDPCRSLRPSLLHALLGDIARNNQRSKFILTHKLVLVRVLSSPNAVYNLIGYLWSCDMLGETLELALGVWSDSSALRHMADRQHLWISSVLMLGINCFKESDEFEEFKPSECQHNYVVNMAVQRDALFNARSPSF